MSKIYRSILIVLTLISFFSWYTQYKKPPSQKKINSLIVGTNAEFSPFSFIENNTIVGFDIDIIKEVADRLNKTLIIKDMPFDALIPEIQLGNIHVIAAGMSPTPEREKRVLFTKPYLSDNPLVIISLASNPPIEKIEDLIGKEVVVNEGYISDKYLSSIAGIFIRRLSSTLISDGMLALKSGRAYAFVAAKNSIEPFFIKQNKKEFQIITITGTDEPDALAISKQYPKLLDRIQSMLNDMKKDGTLHTIKQKWGLV